MKEKIRKILEAYGQTQNDLAYLLGITYQSVSIKLNGHKDFTQSEIFKIMTIFRLTPEQVVDIFFNVNDRAKGMFKLDQQSEKAEKPAEQVAEQSEKPAEQSAEQAEQ